MRILYKSSSVAVFYFCFSHASLSFAALGLSVNPLDGSNSLRLEQPLSAVQNTKQVRVRITSTNGKQYQVFQRILEPIVNEKGERLNLQAVETATITNSNASGTLYMQNVDHLSLGEQLLYSSGQGGESDALTIAYSVRPDLVKSGGNFLGRIIYTVRSTQEPTQGQAELSVSLQASSQWKATVAGGRTPGQVRVNDTDVTEKTADFVKISFTGNSGREVRIYQEMETIPQNAEGQEFQPGVLMFYGAGQTDGLRATSVSPLAPTRTLVYAGRRSEDNFLLYYLMDPRVLAGQESGEYKGKLKFDVETDKGTQEYFVDMECRIQPVFTMEVDVPAQGVSFTHVLAGNPPQEQGITVTVHTNLHKPYQVVQEMQTPMTNEQGKEIAKEYFTVMVELPAGQRGRTRFADFSPAETGEHPVFSSDGKGSAAAFKVTYRLQGYPGMGSGNFSAPIRFSLNQN